MKKYMIILLMFSLGLGQIDARTSIGKVEKIKIVHEFPNTEDYMTNPGRFVDLGILYETFGLNGAPLWITKDPVFVGVENENTDFYLELDPATADEIVAENKLNKEELLKLSVMEKHAGFIYLAIVGLLIYLFNKFFGAKDEDEIEVINENQAKP